MSRIKKYIEEKNNNNEKILSIFLTAGYPDIKDFPELALKVFEAGADIIEMGIPFSDPLADGPVIQKSSQSAIESGVNINLIFKYIETIKSKSNKPIILMGYANPIMQYGISDFLNDAVNAGAEGLIVPDIPVEEYDTFFCDNNKELDIILLTTPTSSDQRIKKIDELSSGFVYCVSITGTTGMRKNISAESIGALKNARAFITRNKMLVGFGISSPENIKEISPYCDGVIVGSSVIKRLSEKDPYITGYISLLKKACFTI